MQSFETISFFLSQHNKQGKIYNIPYLSLHQQKPIISNKKTNTSSQTSTKLSFLPRDIMIMVIDKYITTHCSINMQMRSLSLQTTSVKQIRRKAAIRKKLKGRKGDREVARRALTRPIQKPSLRWLNFQPTPSRLSNMSMASNMYSASTEIEHPVCLVM